jgi:hypothetical protein
VRAVRGYWRRLWSAAVVVVVGGGAGGAWCVIVFIRKGFRIFRDSHQKVVRIFRGSHRSMFSSKKVFVSLDHYDLDPTGFCIFSRQNCCTDPRSLLRLRSPRSPPQNEDAGVVH